MVVPEGSFWVGNPTGPKGVVLSRGLRSGTRRPDLPWRSLPPVQGRDDEQQPSDESWGAALTPKAVIRDALK